MTRSLVPNPQSASKGAGGWDLQPGKLLLMTTLLRLAGALLAPLLGVASMCLPCSVMPHVDHCGGSTALSAEHCLALRLVSQSSAAACAGERLKLKTPAPLQTPM